MELIASHFCNPHSKSLSQNGRETLNPAPLLPFLGEGAGGCRAMLFRQGGQTYKIGMSSIGIAKQANVWGRDRPLLALILRLSTFRIGSVPLQFILWWRCEELMGSGNVNAIRACKFNKVSRSELHRDESGGNVFDPGGTADDPRFSDMLGSGEILSRYYMGRSTRASPAIAPNID